MNDEMLLTVFGWASVLVIILPLARFLWLLQKEAFPRSIIVRDETGSVLGQISAESVQQTEPNEIARLHERIRRSDHVSLEAA